MAEITLGIAALAGLGSFVAPCILPMIPAFLHTFQEPHFQN